MSEYHKRGLANQATMFDLDFDYLLHKSQNKKCICRLQSRMRQIWDISLIILVMWNLGIVMYSSASNTNIQENQVIQYLNLIIDIIFLVDIVVNFRTTYYDNEGDQIYQTCKISKNYMLSTGFVLDFIAAIPLQRFFTNQSLMLFGLIKCIRLRRVPKWLNHLNIKVSVKITLRILVLIIILIIIFNINACAWLLLVRYQDIWIPPTYYIYPIASMPSIFDQTPLFQYFMSLNYIEMLLLISGDAGPITQYQFFTSSFISLIGSILNATLFAIMITYIQEMQARKKFFEQKLDLMRTTMKDLGLPRSAQREVVLFFIKAQSMLMQRSELRLFLSYISPSLKSQVMQELCKDIVAQNKGLIKVINSSESNQLDFLGSLQLQLTDPEQTLFRYGDKSNGLYLIIRGEISLFDIRLCHRGIKKHRVLKRNAHFGQISLVFDTHRTMSAMSNQYSTFAFMDGVEFKKIIQRQKTMKEFYQNMIFNQYNDKIRYFVGRIIKRFQLFEGVSQKEIPEIAYKMRLKSFFQNVTVWQPGSRPNLLMLVLNGGISLQVKIGILNVPLAFAEVGDLIGMDHILCKDKPIDIFYRTVNYTRVLVLKYEDILKKVKNVLDSLSKRAIAIRNVDRSLLRGIKSFKSGFPDNKESNGLKTSNHLQINRSSTQELMQSIEDDLRSEYLPSHISSISEYEIQTEYSKISSSQQQRLGNQLSIPTQNDGSRRNSKIPSLQETKMEQALEKDQNYKTEEVLNNFLKPSCEKRDILNSSNESSQFDNIQDLKEQEDNFDEIDSDDDDDDDDQSDISPSDTSGNIQKQINNFIIGKKNFTKQQQEQQEQQQYQKQNQISKKKNLLSNEENFIEDLKNKYLNGNALSAEKQQICSSSSTSKQLENNNQQSFSHRQLVKRSENKLENLFKDVEVLKQKMDSDREKLLRSHKQAKDDNLSPSSKNLSQNGGGGGEGIGSFTPEIQEMIKMIESRKSSQTIGNNQNSQPNLHTKEKKSQRSVSPRIQYQKNLKRIDRNYTKIENQKQNVVAQSFQNGVVQGVHNFNFGDIGNSTKTPNHLTIAKLEQYWSPRFNSIRASKNAEQMQPVIAKKLQIQSKMPLQSTRSQHHHPSPQYNLTSCSQKNVNQLRGQKKMISNWSSINNALQRNGFSPIPLLNTDNHKDYSTASSSSEHSKEFQFIPDQKILQQTLVKLLFEIQRKQQSQSQKCITKGERLDQQRAKSNEILELCQQIKRLKQQKKRIKDQKQQFQQKCTKQSLKRKDQVMKISKENAKLQKTIKTLQSKIQRLEAVLKKKDKQHEKLQVQYQQKQLNENKFTENGKINFEKCYGRQPRPQDQKFLKTLSSYDLMVEKLTREKNSYQKHFNDLQLHVQQIQDKLYILSNGKELPTYSGNKPTEQMRQSIQQLQEKEEQHLFEIQQLKSQNIKLLDQLSNARGQIGHIGQQMQVIDKEMGQRLTLQESNGMRQELGRLRQQLKDSVQRNDILEKDIMNIRNQTNTHLRTKNSGRSSRSSSSSKHIPPLSTSRSASHLKSIENSNPNFESEGQDGHRVFNFMGKTNNNNNNNIQNLTHEQLVSIVSQTMQHVSLQSPGLLPSAIEKMKKVIRAVPRMETFFKNICNVILSKSSHINISNGQQQQFTPAQTQNLQLIIPTLQKWKSQLKQSQGYQELRQELITVLALDNPRTPNSTIVSMIKRIKQVNQIFSQTQQSMSQMRGKKQQQQQQQQHPPQILEIVKRISEFYSTDDLNKLKDHVNELFIFTKHMRQFLQSMRGIFNLDSNTPVNKCLQITHSFINDSKPLYKISEEIKQIYNIKSVEQIIPTIKQFMQAYKSQCVLFAASQG